MGQCRMLESSYNLLFGKLPLRCLFEDYFEESKHFSTRIMLKPIDDPHVDLIATVSISTLSFSSLIHKYIKQEICFLSSYHVNVGEKNLKLCVLLIILS